MYVHIILLQNCGIIHTYVFAQIFEGYKISLKSHKCLNYDCNVVWHSIMQELSFRTFTNFDKGKFDKGTLANQNGFTKVQLKYPQ